MVQIQLNKWYHVDRNRYNCYICAIILVLLSFLMRQLLAPHGGTFHYLPYGTYFPAVMLAALYGGLRSGILATVLSIGIVFLDIITGNWQEPVTGAEYVGMVAFVLSGAVVSYIAEKIKICHQQNILAHQEVLAVKSQHLVELEQTVKERTFEIARTREAVISAMAILAEYRDTDTGLHVQRVRSYARLLAENYALSHALPDYEIELISLMALVHDIGKVGISDNILLKPAKLTTEEMAIMQTHTTIGGDIIRQTKLLFDESHFLTIAGEMIEFHHEKWDGSGYPRGLKGKDIPLAARIMALVDVYDALTSKRVYKEELSSMTARDILIAASGKHFDPELVNCFLNVEKDFCILANATSISTFGIPVIDEQHHNLAKLHFKLHSRQLQTISSDKKFGLLYKSLLELQSAYREHFATEEHLMLQHGYPERSSHADNHDQFVVTIAQLLEECKDKNARVFNKAMYESVHWVTDHIEVADRELAEWLGAQ